MVYQMKPVLPCELGDAELSDPEYEMADKIEDKRVDSDEHEPPFDMEAFLEVYKAPDNIRNCTEGAAKKHILLAQDKQQIQYKRYVTKFSSWPKGSCC